MDQWKNGIFIMEFHSTDIVSRTQAFLNIGICYISRSEHSEISHTQALGCKYTLHYKNKWDKNIFSNYSYFHPVYFEDIPWQFTFFKPILIMQIFL
jgi:hypothetical protein